jgi:hypothetical protein
MKQLKFNVGSDTYEKWEQIAAGYTSNVAAFAALVESYYWRHQMHEHEEETMEGQIESIRVEFSVDSVAGGEEISRDEMGDYADSLSAELQQEYPGAEVEVVQGINDHVQIYAQDNYRLEEEALIEVQELMHDHWQTWIDRASAAR